MKKSVIKASCLFLLVCCMSACGSNDTTSTDDAQFKIAAQINGMSDAPQLDDEGKGSFANGDISTVFFQDKNGNIVKEFEYTYGNTYYWYDFQLKDNIEGLKVSACYPHVTTSEHETFTWDVTSKEIPTADFLAASPLEVVQGVTSKVPLNFSHMMHRFVVTLVADGTTVSETELAGANITLSNLLPVAVINLKQAKVTGVSGNATAMATNGTKASFILPPQAVGTMEVKVQVGHTAQTFRLSDLRNGNQPLTHLESGKRFNLKLNVSKGSFTITGQNIGSWESQGEASGDIIL